MPFPREESDEILNIFKEECEEILRNFSDGLVAYREDASLEILNKLLRDAHSIKGSASIVGLELVQKIAHKIEDLLTLLKTGETVDNIKTINIIFGAADILFFLVKNASDKEIQRCASSAVDKYMMIIEEGGNIKDLSFETREKILKDYFFFLYPRFCTETSAILTAIENQNSEPSDKNYKIIGDSLACAEELLESPEVEDFENILSLKDKINISVKNFRKSKTAETLNLIKTNIIEFMSDFNDFLNTDKRDCSMVTTNVKSVDKKEILRFVIQNIPQIKTDKTIINIISSKLSELLHCSDADTYSDLYSKILSIFDKIKEIQDFRDNNLLNLISGGLKALEKTVEEDTDEKDALIFLKQRLFLAEQMLDVKNDTVDNDISVKPPGIPKKAGLSDIFKNLEQGSLKTLRVETDKLDFLYSSLNELNMSYERAQNIYDRYTDTTEIYNERIFEFKRILNYVKRKSQKTDAGADELLQALTYAAEIIGRATDNLRDLTFDCEKLRVKKFAEDLKFNRTLSEITKTVDGIRILPLGIIFHMFPRMVRDIASLKNKEIEMEIKGGETGVDKKILEEIKMPLIHILRNAVDHGIETPEERVRQNKSPCGKILISAEQKENFIIIRVNDDGVGLDIDKIKEKAVKKGYCTREQIEEFSQEEIQSFVFKPGFSTEDKVSEISGRGIGLDVVKTKLSELRGTIKVNSSFGQGTEIELIIPCGVTTLKCFITEIKNRCFAVPVESTAFVTVVKAEEIITIEGINYIFHDNKKIPIFDAGEVLSIRSGKNYGNSDVIAISDEKGNTVALSTDRIIQTEELTEKTFMPPIYKIADIRSAAVTESGLLCLILNTEEIIEKLIVRSSEFTKSGRQKADDKPIVPENYKIAVIDDSKTTKILFTKILNAEGYHTVGFDNAINALPELEHQNFDLIISDIEMPGMNGVDLTDKIRNNDILCNTPILIISMLPFEEASQRLRNVKVDALLNKSDFNKTDFLRTISTLLLFR